MRNVTTPTATPLTRKQLRDDARRRRVERERAAAAAAARRRKLARLAAVLAAAAVVVAGLIAVSGSGSAGGAAQPAAASGDSASVAGASESRALLAGISQKGLTLGDPTAPVRVVEFADLQCPACRDYATNVMPRLIKDYVRTGKARMEFRALAFIGPDSVRSARFAEAAGQQNKLWNFVDLAYANQGNENSGWATDSLLRRLATAVPGLDVNRAFAARDGAAVTGQLRAADTLATTSGVRATPTFLVGRGSSLKQVTAADLPAAIDAAVGR
jgi:protein-disulfide isomerase